MNYYQIEAFLSIASTQSLSRAAELLYVAQSTVSHRLSTLEKELGVTLVFRNKGNRVIELTPAGERFLPIARRWEVLWDETKKIEEIDPVIPLNIGGVTASAPTSSARYTSCCGIGSHRSTSSFTSATTPHKCTQ